MYIIQSHRVNEALRLKSLYSQEQTILLHYNPRPHIAEVIKAALQELEWQVPQHQPYSQNLAPTELYLSRSLSNHVRGITFDNEYDLKSSSTTSTPYLPIFGEMV